MGLISALFIYGYVASYVQIVRIDEIYYSAPGNPPDAHECHFNLNFPSADAIQSYLHEATLLISDPLVGNRVFYFDEGHGYVKWRENVIENGVWWTSPRVQILFLGSRWRVAIVQTFCMFEFGLPPGVQEDNCYSVGSLDSLLGAGRRSRREYREGNVFNLEVGRHPPVPLPRSEVSISYLLSKAAKDH